MSGFLRCCKCICECIYSNGHVLLSGLPRLRLGLFYACKTRLFLNYEEGE
nr:MAG TPA: Protein of unknown function (DUF2615) [Caudoviricetes sp.]